MPPPEKFTRPSWDEYFMLQAELAKLRSNCLTRKVGAVIVRDNRQIATGYNGTPPHIRNCYEGGCDRCRNRMSGRVQPGSGLDRCVCSHAEANAIMHCAMMGITVGGGSTVYTTYVPCLECAKMAITVGIRRFVCLGTYAEDSAALTGEAGVTVEMMDRARVEYWARRLISAAGGSSMVVG